ncbi:MAG: hypothetical protein K0U41_01290, partial [Gammaproteobacteria bacterium]|nr:hypothetical protein [Gammaproteobacteria bacterium]
GGIDYETFAAYRGQLENIILSIADTGRYTKTAPSGLPLPLIAQIPGTSATTTLALDITLTNVREAPQLTLSENALEISENADIGTILSTDANSPITADTVNNFNAIAVNLNNTAEIGSLVNVTYTVSPANAAAIFEASPSAVPLSANGGSQGIILSVINSTLLENFGDGQEHPISITVTFPATDDSPALSSSIVQNIMLVDNPANSNFDPAALPTDLTINEQDVVSSADNSFTLDGFSININALAKDADEFVPVGDNRRVVTPTLTLESMALANNATGSLSPTLDKANTIELVETNGVLTLVVQDPDFIESALFGNLAVNLQGSTTASAAQVTPIAIAIAVTQAAGKSVAYANTARDSATPPVYALRYTQTGYADAVTDFTGIDATTITTIDADTDFNFGGAAISGVAGDYINISDDNVYSALALVDAEGEPITGGNFIARDYANPATFNSLNSINTAVENGVNININFAADTLSLLDANGQHQFDILKPNDATGNLEDARAEFNAYFNLAVNNTANERSIQIAQKVFAQADNDTRKYNALDTIQLYQDQANGDGEAHTLNYFIRARAATDGTTNASNYALAQFSVAVSAAGLNDPSEIMRVALVPSGDTDFTRALVESSSGSTLTITENNITTNSFANHDLLIQFNNPDAVEESAIREAASTISVAVATGAVTGATASDNTANDGQLISLRAKSDDSSAPAAGAVALPAITSGAFNATAGAAGGLYTLGYDFALAQNLAGTARIIITIEEFEGTSGTPVSLGEHQIPLTLVVTPSNAAPVPTLTTQLAGSGQGISFAFAEDASPLPASGASDRDVSIAASATVADDDGAIGRSTTSASLARIEKPSANPDDNPLKKPVFNYVNPTLVTYNEHSWGVDDFTFDVAYTEPRGFAAAPITYTLPTTRNITVTATADPTTLVSFTDAGNFLATDFTNPATTAVSKPVVGDAAGSVVFADPDLLYDNRIGMVLGDTVTLETTRTTPAPLVFTASGVYDLTLVGPSNPTQATTTSGIGYSLSLSQANALASVDVDYEISFSFNNVANNAAGTMIAGSNASRVTFSESASNPTRIDSVDIIFPASNGVASPGTLSIAEGTATGLEYGTLTIQDFDISKSSPSTPGTYTYTITGGNPGGDLFAWKDASQAGTDSNNRRTNSLVLTRAADDTDVGTHTIGWQLSDSKAIDNTGRVLTGSIELTITRVEDAPTDGAITFADTGSDLIINTNTNRGKNFPISLAFTDRDFLEPVPPLRELTSVTYESVDFTVARPTGAAGTTTCSLSVGGSGMFGDILPTPSYDRASGVTVITSSNLFRASAALTFANIDSACSGLQIGTQITGASFKSVTVANDGVGATPNFVGTGTIATTFANPYTIQGYRQQTPDINVNGYANDVNTHAVKVSPNGNRTITVTIIDRDPDDGTPTNRMPANTVRTDGTGASWPGELLVSTTCNSAQIATVTTPNPFRSVGANTEYDVVLSGAANAIGTCSVTILAAGEDGQFFTPQVLDITFEAVPTFNIPAFSLPADIDYTASFIVDGTVTSGDDDDGDIALSIESNSAVCDATLAAASVAGNSAQTPIALPTITVTPKSPGLCTLVITGNEGGAIESVSPSINFPELAPTWKATQFIDSDGDMPLNNLDMLPTGNRDASTSAFQIYLTATNRDPGDDAGRAVDVRVAIATGGTGVCNVLALASTGNYATDAIGGTFTVGYVVTPSSIAAGGVCQEITITATEDGKKNTFVIPEGTLIFDSAPTIRRSDSNPLPTVTAYGNTVSETFEVTVNNFDQSTVTRSIAVTGFDSNLCTVTSSALTAATGEAMANITVTPLRPSATGCAFNITATEDGVASAPLEITIPLPELAPAFRANVSNILAATAFEHYAPDAVTLSSLIVDNDFGDFNDPGDTGKPVLTYTPNDACTIRDEFTSSFNEQGEASGGAKVTLVAPGRDCIIEATLTEGSHTVGPVTFTISQAQIAPLVNIPAPAAATAGSSATIIVTATKQDAGSISASDVVFPPNIAASPGCTVTSFIPASFSPVTIGNTYTAEYLALRNTAGDCTIDKAQFVVTEDGVGDAASNGLSGSIAITFDPSLTPPTLNIIGGTAIPRIISSAASYASGLEISTELTDRDASDGERPTLIYTLSDSTFCTLSDKSVGSFGGTGVAFGRFRVTPLLAGTMCEVTVTPTEQNINGTPSTITIDQQHVAPSLAVPATATDMAGSSVRFNVTATKQDTGSTANVVFAGGFTADGCTVTRGDATIGNSGYAAIGDTYVQQYIANNSAGVSCTLAHSLFTVAEDGKSSTGGIAGNLVITFPFTDLAPTAVAVSPASTVTINTTAQYELYSSSGLVITTNVSDGDPNDVPRPTLSYTAVPAGACSVVNQTLSDFVGFFTATATATANVILNQPGTTCVVTATPSESGTDGTAATFTLVQQQIAPLLTIDATASGTEGNAVTFEVTATKQDPGLDSVTF